MQDDKKKARRDEKRKDRLEASVCQCSKKNVAEVLLMFMSLFKRHSLTWAALLDIFCILNVIFGIDVLPTTKYMVKQLMNFTKETLKYHILCKECKNYIGIQSELKGTILCNNCSSKVDSSELGSFFIELDVRSQLEKFLANENIASSLEEALNRKKEDDNLRDIYDGRVYQEYVEMGLLGNTSNLSYTFNTDGCQPADKSKVTVWPIYMMIHELPSYLRNKCMPLAGLWVAKQEPEMTTYLQPFVKQAEELSLKGFEWCRNSKQVWSRLFGLGGCVDAVARCAMLHMKKFNGKFGCTYCEHPTETVNKVCKYPMLTGVPKRTHESIKRQMLEAHQNEGTSDVKGVWGLSPLINLPDFDLARGMIVDFMHSCLLGVTELYMTIILSNAAEPYYVGSPAQTNIINGRLLAMKPPTCMGKVPRGLAERNMWNASEWLQWLIFYSLICLNGVLPQKNYENLALFVAAMEILLQDCISPAMLREAKKLLTKFVFWFENLYGKQYMHYNIHLLRHLADNVENWGPIWADSTFPFENQNRLLMQMKKSNYRIAEQIVHRLMIYQQIPLLANEDCVSKDVVDFCNGLHKKRLKKVQRVKDCILLGFGKPHILTQRELRCVKRVIDVEKIVECTKYLKMVYNDCRYTSASYKRCKKTNDSIFQTKADEYGMITNICRIEAEDTDNVIIFFKAIDVGNASIVANDDVAITHLVECQQRNNSLCCMDHQQLHRTCLISSLNGKYFLGTISKGVMGSTLN